MILHANSKSHRLSLEARFTILASLGTPYPGCAGASIFLYSA
jgi:hypothetical protein